MYYNVTIKIGTSLQLIIWYFICIMSYIINYYAIHYYFCGFVSLVYAITHLWTKDRNRTRVRNITNSQINSPACQSKTCCGYVSGAGDTSWQTAVALGVAREWRIHHILFAFWFWFDIRFTQQKLVSNDYYSTNSTIHTLPTYRTNQIMWTWALQQYNNFLSRRLLILNLGHISS